MASKRSYNEIGHHGESSVTAQSGDAKRRKHHDASTSRSKTTHKSKEGSINWAKTRARAIERLFNKNQDLPANVKNDLERELAAHRATIADRNFQKKRSAMISKYHMVRFFERKKAMRLIKQLRRKIDASDDQDEKHKLRQELHVAEIDEAYTQNYPHAEPYVSLYGNVPEGQEDPSVSERPDPETSGSTKTPTARAALTAERPAIWKDIEKAVEEGPGALRRLRERRPAEEGPTLRVQGQARRRQSEETGGSAVSGGGQAAKAEPAKANNIDDPRMAGLNRRERRKLMHQSLPSGRRGEASMVKKASDDDDDDDGEGFFEEG